MVCACQQTRAKTFPKPTAISPRWINLSGDMGLTVHFKLTASAGVSAMQAKKLVVSLHRVAMRFQEAGQVDKVHPVTADAKTLQQVACNWLILPVPGEENTSTGAEVVPLAGFVFCVEAGAGCEPLWLGLCQYPRTVIFQGRELPTRMGAGWRLAGFTKTQYASLHGWEHFRRCHCAMVNVLAAGRSPGLRVMISDEGKFWPRRSLAGLRENLDHMNGLVAAVAGVLKDEDGLVGGDNGVQAPIFAHKNFERLEAEGALRSATALETLRAVMRKL